jgi:hypothetical protein
MKTFEKRVQSKIFVPAREEVTGRWAKLHTYKFMTRTSRQILLGLSNKEHKIGGVCGTNGSEDKTFRWEDNIERTLKK